jgi:hypothetical protein
LANRAQSLKDWADAFNALGEAFNTWSKMIFRLAWLALLFGGGGSVSAAIRQLAK